MSGKYRRKQAFTLIELLIVVAIISILAAILFPVFARARESARKTSCLSNLKQIGIAWMMYAQDYDERAVPSYYYNSDWSLETAWDFTLDSSNIVDWDNPTPESSPGLLDTYAKNGQINACPSFTGNKNGRPATGYAYNATYIGGDSSADPAKFAINIAQITNPAGTVLFAEGGYKNAGETEIRALNYLRAPSDDEYRAGTVHFRHNGTANVAYADGHVKATNRKFGVEPATLDIGYLSDDDSAYDLD